MTAARPMSDLGALLERAQGGDAQAYAEALHAMLPLIHAYLAGHFPGLRDADDVAQETLITVHRIRHTYDPQRPAAPWLLAIARHRALDYLRRRRRLAEREIQDEAAISRSAAPDGFAAAESREAALALLVGLPERERKVIEAMKIDGASVKDVAGRLGLSESHVKVLASRGYAKLRRRRRERHGRESG